MANRRTLPNRPASSEELECWSHAKASLKALSDICENPSSFETFGRVNRLISAWPTDDTLPAEGIDGVKSVYKKLASALGEVKSLADAEAKAIDDVIESLGVLIALRKASESIPLEKRPKRPRGHSPSTAAPSGAGTPTPSVVRNVSITLPARASAGPSSSVPFSRDPKARREALAKQLPLQEGRNVAFHPPPHGAKPGETSNGDGDDNAWILAVIMKCINQDKNRYEVRDAEPQDDGQPGQCYNTTLRAIIPLPDPKASPDSPAHLNAYQEFPAGATVMALYPDTSCFYKAEVIVSFREMPLAASGMPQYKLKFEDDDDQEHPVYAHLVTAWPGP
ncbi:hypothetical protein JAAARDRAFT_30341 [Jaapia argillacea MUCL 33604]|uniref:SGF29 C-terminal domain-containing protein n=1 Tax=Jaapia argillacea MUCL 33604 TaxID=933084 RepID=A0A067Q659_9AGAM|nr:hypothetical protein JAAARDRAFT_30341 [Jaapia argillacea MUCL 33604]